MTRKVPEWIGKTPDTPVPPRVRLRVFERFNRCCAHCTRPIAPGERWACDHKRALINGGQNRESNLHPLCSWCEPEKNRADVRLKADAYRKASKHWGVKPQRGRPMPGTYASGIYKPMHGPARWRDSGEPLGRPRTQEPTS